MNEPVRCRHAKEGDMEITRMYIGFPGRVCELSW